MVSSPPQDTIAEALRLAVLVASARGALDPLDLAAAELALCRPGLAEDASHGWARANLPLLVGDPRRGTRASHEVPFGATSWRTIFRRAHNPDAKLALGAGCGFWVEHTTGRLWSWGEPGARGDLGGFETRVPAPIQTLNRVKVTAVSVGDKHVLACDSAGAVWSWGDASHGKLGTPREERRTKNVAFDVWADPRATPRRVAGFGVDADGIAPVTGDQSDDAESFEVNTNKKKNKKKKPPAFAVSVAAGAEHSAAVDAAGGAWAWGANDCGQCGVYSATGSIPFSATSSPRPRRLECLFRAGARVVAAAAGKTTTFLLDERGKTWRCFSNAASVGAWALGGSNESDGSFDGDADADSGSDAESDSGSVSENDAETVSATAVPKRKNKVARLRWCVRAFAPHLIATHVALKHEHALFVDRRGDAYGWGKSADGATGVGIFAVTMAGPLRNGALRDAGRLRRAAVSAHHTLVLACDGKVYGFGKNASHELDAKAGATFAGPLRVSVPPGGGCGAKTKTLGSNDDADDTAACVAIAAGAFVANRDSGALFAFSRGGGYVGASAAVRASDGRVLTWGAPRPWLGRGGRVDDAWAPGNEPAPVRFEETASFGDERGEKAAKDEASGPSRAAAVA